jgi:hypothetical protein
MGDPWRSPSLRQPVPIPEDVAMDFLQAEKQGDLLEELDAPLYRNKGGARHGDPGAGRDEIKGVDDPADVSAETEVRLLHAEGQTPFGDPFEDALMDDPLVRNALPLAADAAMSVGDPTLHGMGDAQFEPQRRCIIHSRVAEQGPNGTGRSREGLTSVNDQLFHRRFRNES